MTFLGHLLDMLFPTRRWPNHIPSINDAEVGGNVGISEDDPSGNGTVRCDGRGGHVAVGLKWRGVGVFQWNQVMLFHQRTCKP
jgi:hypothetical protein